MNSLFFPAFFDKPQGISYGEQEPNEVIELMLRRHWVTNVGWILTALFLFTLPAIALAIGQSLNISFANNIVIGAIILWYLLILGYIIEQFLYWYYNIYIVTNIHIIDINFFSLLYRDVTESQLNDIEVVSSKIAGILGSLFNFGDVVVETAAENRTILFESVPKPDFVADRIDELRVNL